MASDILETNLHVWLFPVIVVLAVVLFNQLVRWLIAVRLRRKKPENHVWSHALLWALHAPVRLMVWLVAAAILKERFLPTPKGGLADTLFVPAMGILAALVMTWFLLRLIDQVKRNYIARARSRNKPIDITGVDALSKLAWALVIVFACISVLHELGVSLASLLAFGGAAGIAVGFAAQNLVANLFGGLTIYVSGIFKMGEDIIVPGTELSGTVEHIGWRSTRVLGWDGKPFYVPNSLFNSSNMINHSRLIHRTISENILLHYRDIDKVEAIIDAGNQVLNKRDDVDYFSFRFDGFGDRALKLNIYAWVRQRDGGGFLPYAEFARIKQEILLSLMDLARNQGCDLNLPVTNIYMREEP